MAVMVILTRVYVDGVNNFAAGPLDRFTILLPGPSFIFSMTYECDVRAIYRAVKLQLSEQIQLKKSLSMLSELTPAPWRGWDHTS